MSPARAAAGGRRAHRTSLGALALTGSSAVRLVVQLAILPVLGRLVGPSEYGLVALAMPFILFANVLADGGLSYALGRRQEVSPALESTVFWLSAGVSGALTLICCLAAWPAGLLLGQPRLPLLITALSPILLMNGLTAASNARIIREGRFAVFAGGDLASTLLGAGAALAAATHGWGAWSLAVQQLAFWLVKLVWISLNGRAAVRLVCRVGEAKSLIRFGAHAIAAMLADFVSRNVDNLIVGGVLGTTQLGFYAMAYLVIRAPDMLISGPLYLYIFTAFSRAAHEPRARSVQDLAVSALRLAAAGFAPLFCGLALTADLIVPLVLGDKWDGAVAPLRFLAGAGFGFCMCAMMSAAAMGLGRSGLQLRMSLIMGAAAIVVVALAAPAGLVAVSAALAVAIAAVCALYVRQLAGDLRMRRRALLAAFTPALSASAVMSAALLAVRWLMRGGSPLVELAAVIAIGAAIYGALLLAFARHRLLADARAFGQAQADRAAVQTAAAAGHAAEAATAAVA
jgi:PST family polysaccharide transporter